MNALGAFIVAVLLAGCTCVAILGGNCTTTKCCDCPQEKKTIEQVLSEDEDAAGRPESNLHVGPR